MQKGRLKVRIPNPNKSDISPDLYEEALKQARILKERWNIK